MTGTYYTEAQKKAIKKYFAKLKQEGKERSHGDPDRNKYLMYKANAILLIKYLFKEN